MGWLKNIFRPKDASEDLLWKIQELIDSGGGFPMQGGYVSESLALKHSAVFGCVRLIGAALAGSPLLVYKGTLYDKRRDLAPQHPLSSILRIRPNPQMSSASFWRGMIKDKLLRGNAYARIIRNDTGRPIQLRWVPFDRVAVNQAWQLGLDTRLGYEPEHLFYTILLDNGKQATLSQVDMIHVPNVIGNDPTQGLSTISAGASGIQVGLDAQEHAGRFFRQGAQFNFAISFPQKISRETVDITSEYFKKKHGGVRNAYLPPLLGDGGKIEPFSVPPKDSQLIESRQFSVIDICRWFGIAPVMMGETEKTSSWGSGVEQMGRWFNVYCMNDHYNAIEQEIYYKMFWGGQYFAEFDETELLRGDTKTQYEAYNIARGSSQAPGFMTVNEIRQDQGRQPIDGGDELYKPEAAKGASPNEGQAQGTV